MVARILGSFLLFGAAAAGQSLQALYFFGDSLTDTGNVYRATTVLHSDTFGLVPVEPAAPYVAGRFTDGPVWPEYAASILGKSPDAAYAGMSMGVFGQVGGPGNNYAVGGADTGSGGALGFINFAIPTGMAEQVSFYLGRHDGKADATGTYFLLGGGNDLRSAAQISNAAERQQAAITAAENLSYDLRNLYLAGARKFVLINAPDIGLIPESISDGVTAAGTDASTQFNSWLSSYAAYLRTVPGLSLTYFDLFALHHALVNEYGMSAVRECKGGAPGLCSVTLFFDSIHPTTWVHQIIGQDIANAVMSAVHSNAVISSAAKEQSVAP